MPSVPVRDEVQLTIMISQGAARRFRKNASQIPQEIIASRRRTLLPGCFVRLPLIDQVRDENREYGGRRDIAHEETPGSEQEAVLQAQCLHGHVFRQPPADEDRI